MATATHLLEMCWDGTNWVDETARVADRPITYDYGLMPAGGSLGHLGHGPVAQLTMTLRNSDGRYSPTHAGSQAATYGIYQVPVRWSAGYVGGGGLEVIFRGRVQRAPARESKPDVTVTCYGYDHDIQQQRPETIALAGKRTDELITILATVITYSPTSIERGYTVVPWYYADGDDCLAELREIAEAEGGLVWVDPQDATLKFWTWDHWVGASSVATIARSGGTEEVKLTYDYASVFDEASITYQPRRKGRLMVVHSLTSPVLIPANSSVQQRFRFRYPLAEFVTYETNARSSGGEDLNAYLTVETTTPAAATYWLTTLTNSHTRLGMVVDKFEVIGRPVEGLSNREYRYNASTLTVPRRTDVRPTEEQGRYCLQHEAQARLIAGLKTLRLSTPPRVYTIGPLPGNENLSIGDVVTLNMAAGVTTVNEAVVLLHRHGSYWPRWEETWTAVPLAQLIEYVAASSGTGDGFHVVGTSRLSYGRLGY